MTGQRGRKGELVEEPPRRRAVRIAIAPRNIRVVSGDVVTGAGDLRRILEKDEEILKKNARESMKRNPATIGGSELASGALELMEAKKITSLFITDSERRVEGIIHLHDLWGLELF